MSPAVISPAVLGFIRGIGTVALFAALNYVGDASHLSGVLSTSVATLVAGLALMLEHALADKKGSPLFGAVRIQK